MNTVATLSCIARALMLLLVILAIVLYLSSKKRIWLVTASIALIAAVIQPVTAVIHMRQ